MDDFVVKYVTKIRRTPMKGTLDLTFRNIPRYREIIEEVGERRTKTNNLE